MEPDPSRRREPPSLQGRSKPYDTEESMTPDEGARLQAAKEKAVELEDELSALRQQSVMMEEQFQLLSRDRERVAGGHASPTSQANSSIPASRSRSDGSGTLTPRSDPDVPARLVGDEISQILTSAEEAARRIVVRAEHHAEEQQKRIQEERAQLEREMANLTRWQGELDHRADRFAESIAAARASVLELPHRITELLAPLLDGFSAVAAESSELVRTLSPAGEREEG